MPIDIKDSDVLLVFSYIAEISGDKNLKFRTTAGQFLRVFLGLKKKKSPHEIFFLYHSTWPFTGLVGCVISGFPGTSSTIFSRRMDIIMWGGLNCT